MVENERNLRRFSEMDNVEVAKEDPDVRGWDVVGSDGRDLGEVKDLLVDTSQMKVRALEVELDGKALNRSDNRRVAIPVDSVSLDEQNDKIVMNGLGYDEVGRLQEFGSSQQYSSGTDRLANTGQARDHGWETRSEAGREPRGEAGRDLRNLGGDERDRLTRAEEEVRIGKREVEAGEVHVGKHVETEHVSQPVSRARERVRIERRPVTDQTAGDIRMQDDEIRVPVVEEEVIVEKRPVVKEELVVSKERVEETQNVETDVKKERFDIDKQGSVDDDGKIRPKGGR